MDFSEADQRYRELREQLAGGKIDPGEYEKGAALLRVLGEDGVWWAIHPRNGKWLRWDGKAWQPDEPPHRKSALINQCASQETVLLDEKPPVGVVLKGEEALRHLLEIRRICEEFTPQGMRYMPVDLKPGGLLRGVAYKLEPDGSLNPMIAILYAAADSAEGKKLYVGGHWVIVPTENGAENHNEPPTEKQVFASLVREMIDNLEIGYDIREKIKANLDLNQITLVDEVALPELPYRWWQAQIPATGAVARDFQKNADRLSEALTAETKAAPRRKLLEEIIALCERSLEEIGEGDDQPLLAGIHTALAAALVELGVMETDASRRADGLHLAEDHAELVEWYTRAGTSNLATVGTLKWLADVRKKASQSVTGVQAQALQQRLGRTEQMLAQVGESYLAKKKQALRDLYAARALESGGRIVDQLEERHKVLAVALWQVQAAQQLALKIGDASLVGQCQETLALIEAQMDPLRGEYA